jgi:Protein of unknown function (DUF3592)
MRFEKGGLMSKKFTRVLIMVLGGFVGAYFGYWIGHLAGWSENADWPFKIGGGDGAIGMSIGMSVLGVGLVGLMLAVPSLLLARRLLASGERGSARVLRTWDLGLRVGPGFGRGQFGFEVEFATDTGSTRHASGIQWFTPEELRVMVPGAEVAVRYDPDRPDDVIIEFEPRVMAGATAG